MQSGPDIVLLNFGTMDTNALVMALQGIGYNVICCHNVNDVGLLAGTDPCRGCIVVSDNEGELDNVGGKVKNLKPVLPLFVITNIPLVVFLENTLIKGYSDHIVNADAPDLVKWVVENVKKNEVSDYSGLGHYVVDKKNIHSIRISNSKNKEEYIHKIMKHIKDNPVHGRKLHDVEDILDEMITNAIYNAPVDMMGRFLFQGQDRKDAVVLNDSQAATLSCAVENGQIFLSVKDPFGSLCKSKLITYLSKCYKDNQVYVENKKGGAGIGLHKIFRLSHNFVVNIDPGRFSEVIACVSFRPECQTQETVTLDLFVKEAGNGKV